MGEAQKISPSGTPPPIPLIGFAAALKTTYGKERAANLRVWMAKAFLNFLPPSNKCPSSKWCVCWMGGMRRRKDDSTRCKARTH